MTYEQARVVERSGRTFIAIAGYEFDGTEFVRTTQHDPSILLWWVETAFRAGQITEREHAIYAFQKLLEGR